MATNQQALLRQWHMLQLVPRAPLSIEAGELCRRLEALEFPVTKRTVERDLVALSEVFPLVCDDTDKPFKWSWLRGAQRFDLPGLTVPEALTMTLVEQHLRHHLPPSTAEALQPYFASAARTLSTEDDPVPSKAWLRKVRSVPPHQPLIPPRMDHDCQRTVYLALMEDRQLTLHYRKRDAAEVTVYDAVHPLAIVQRGGIIYLACMFGAYEDVRTIPLHRIVAAEARYEDARKKEGFDLDAYIASGQFGVIAGEPLRLRARFTRAAGEHLYETPLSADQELTADGDGGLRLVATVPNTRSLVWWLLGFGDGVVIEEPASLRQEMAGIAAKMAQAYA